MELLEIAGDKLDKIRDSDVLLLFVESENLATYSSLLTRFLLGLGGDGIYVSANKPHADVEGLLRSLGVDVERIYFIDCVTSLVRNPTSAGLGKVKYVDHLEDAGSLDDLRKSISSRLKASEGDVFLVIDSLRTLRLYNDQEAVLGFVRFLIEASKESGVKAVILTNEADREFSKLIKPEIDDIVHI